MTEFVKGQVKNMLDSAVKGGTEAVVKKGVDVVADKISNKSNKDQNK